VKHTILIALLWGLSIQSYADTLTGRVVQVTGGDTIVVLDSEETRHNIRLQGIDAPERGQAYGIKSMEHLSDSVAGKFVVVEYDKRDSYEQILGIVSLGGEDMNLEQVRSGLAWHSRKYMVEQTVTDRVKYSDAETDARRHGRGLWRAPDPVPPWAYRKAQRERKKAMEPFIIKSQSRGKPF